MRPSSAAHPAALALVVWVVRSQHVHVVALSRDIGFFQNLLVAILGVPTNSSDEAMELVLNDETGVEGDPSVVLASSAHLGGDG